MSPDTCLKVEYNSCRVSLFWVASGTTSMHRGLKVFYVYIKDVPEIKKVFLSRFTSFCLPMAADSCTHGVPIFFHCTYAGGEPLTFRIPLTYQSLLPLHYEVQLRSTPRKIIFILLDSLTFQKIYITIYLFICLTRVSRSTKTCIGFFNQLGP